MVACQVYIFLSSFPSQKRKGKECRPGVNFSFLYEQNPRDKIAKMGRKILTSWSMFGRYCGYCRKSHLGKMRVEKGLQIKQCARFQLVCCSINNQDSHCINMNDIYDCRIHQHRQHSFCTFISAGLKSVWLCTWQWQAEENIYRRYQVRNISAILRSCFALSLYSSAPGCVFLNE